MQRCLNPRKDGNNISVHLVDLLESHCSAEAIRSDFASEASNLNGIGGLADLNLRVARPQRHVGGGRSSPNFYNCTHPWWRRSAHRLLAHQLICLINLCPLCIPKGNRPHHLCLIRTQSSKMKMDKRLDVLFVETNLVANIMDNLLVKVRFCNQKVQS